MFPEFLREWLKRDSDPESTHSQSVLCLLSSWRRPQNQRKTKKLTMERLTVDLENSLTVLHYHNNVKNDYHFLLFVRLTRKRAQSHRDELQPLRNLFLLGVKHANAEGIDPTTR